jgi:hypothetical protein
MTKSAIEYLTDLEGNPRAVVIPIELWQRLLPQGGDSTEALAETWQTTVSTTPWMKPKRRPF